MVVRRKKAKATKPRKAAPKKRKAAVRKKKAAPKKATLDKGDKHNLKVIKKTVANLKSEMGSVVKSIADDIRKKDSKTLRKDLVRAKLAYAKGCILKEGLKNAIPTRKKRK